MAEDARVFGNLQQKDAAVHNPMYSTNPGTTMNPVDRAAAQSSTGSANAPLNTGSTYGNTSTGANVTHHTNTNVGGHATGADAVGGTTTGHTTGAGGSAVGGHGSGIKGIAAGIHGLGEKVRGEFNTVVDRAFNEREGVAKNRAVADAGDMERETGRFAGSTKDREGAIPGATHERRF
ncbi:uncharacterized protein PAC_12830 [Phialocephala subalpina]|uniref:Uncharacterized protein n=1 Tax=Phialocephala subalpina TaxID=576137 RepID=A0A1L7XD39_9HELO|nr:uncharacterized protein PAC_12830 [Phialocephala subalpina]